MSAFPKKIFEMPFQNDPRPDIYKQLTIKNAEYPITSINNEDCWLPDFSRAIELGDFIYRVNVPGYFYKCPSGSSMSSNSSSGIVIDAFNMAMDTVAHHDHRISIISSSSTSILGVHDSLRQKTNHDSFLTKSFKLSITCVKDKSYTGKYKIDIEPLSDGGATYKPEDESVFSGNVNVNGVNCNVAVLANQRRCPEYSLSGDGKPFARDLASNYVVHTGKNNCGGIMNSLVPIIPGVATTKRPLACNCLSESALAAVTRLAKVDKNYYCIYFCPDKNSTCEVEGLLEAKGTYIFANRTADKIFFVPAKSVGNTVKPLTRIRGTTSKSCTYNIPGSSSSYSDSIGPTTSATLHYQKKSYCEWCEEDGKHYSGTLDGVNYNGDIEGCYIYYNPHDSSFDQTFRDIFANPPSDLKVGLKEKFVAQILTLKDWPGVYTGSADDLVGHATVQAKDPTTDGAS